MGFLNNIWGGIGRFISKYLFGLDYNKQQKTISILKKRINQLENTNSKLQEKLKKQEILLNECEEKTNFLSKPLNKYFTFKYYFSVSNSKSSIGVEYIYSGIVNRKYDEDYIIKELTKTEFFDKVINYFEVEFGNARISNINASGYDESLTEQQTSQNIEVELKIENKTINKVLRLTNPF